MAELRQLLTELASYDPILDVSITEDEVTRLMTETSMKTSDKDRLYSISSLLEGYSSVHPNYGRLAGRLLNYTREKYGLVSGKTFSQRMTLINTRDRKLSEGFLSFLNQYESDIDSAIVRQREYGYTYFATKTIEQIYLARDGTEPMEGIEDWYMRVAIQLAMSAPQERQLEECLDVYTNFSLRRMVMATPVNTNSGYEQPQLSSCFLTYVGDSIPEIYTAAKECAEIHSRMGGCAISIQDIRSQGAHIKTTGGDAAGMMAFASPFDLNSKIVVSGGRRSGTNAAYCEPHHPEIVDFLNMRTLRGDKEKQLRALFTGLMVSDTFMKRVERGDDWYLLDPSVYPGLSDLWGDEYEKRYGEYVQVAKELLDTDGKDIVHQFGYNMRVVTGNCAVMKAADVWHAIKVSISDSSTPYILSKDSINRSNQHSNRGTIKMSNMCTEILEYADDEETAVCTLGNLVLPSFLYMNDTGKLDYNHKSLHSASKRMCYNLNYVLDAQWLPNDRATRSSEGMRSIGIGIQGLADVFIAMGIEYGSEESKRLNRLIAETIHHGAMEASCELAAVDGAYPHFLTNGGSYLANGRFHHELRGYSGELAWDWEPLRGKPVRNSLMIAYAPTSTTSIVQECQESFQPVVSNMVARRTLTGDYVVVEPRLVEKLEELNLWNAVTRKSIIESGGSVAHLPIPDKLKSVFKTAYEIKQKHLIDMAVDRQYFVDQSQSLNLFNTQPDNVSSLLDSILMYGWKVGLKTMMYYFRSKPAADPLAISQYITKAEASVTESTPQEVVEESKTEIDSIRMSLSQPIPKSNTEAEDMICRREAGCVYCE